MPAVNNDDPGRLLTAAVAGDRPSLERLLLSHYDRLCRQLEVGIPPELRAVVTAEDVLQDVFVDAFRAIGSFRPPADDPAAAFAGWLDTIARHRLLDQVKSQRAAKRGGGRQAIGAGNLAGPNGSGDPESALAGLLDLLAVDEHTPSRSVARREAATAVRAALETLKPEYRDVLRLRYLQGHSAAEVAKQMGRSEGSVHMLASRALDALRANIGSASAFFSTAP